jgi:uncharacterized surface anchored protein
MKKILIFFITILIGLNSINGLVINVSAAAMNVTTQIAVVDATLEVKSASGTVINPDVNGDYVNVPRDAKIKIRYDFNLLDENPDTLAEFQYAAGDYYQIQLPDELLYVLPGGSKELKVANTNDVLGVLTISSSGLATITFTDYVETHSGMFGWFEIEGTFSDVVLNNPTTSPIELQFNGTIISIGLVPPDEPNVNVAVTKNGVYNPATNLITWTVVMTPDGRTSNITITDTYSANQTYVLNSMTLEGVSITPTLNSATRTLTYLIENSFNTPITLSYQTQPTSNAFTQENGSNETISLTNTVKLFRNNTEIAQSAATIVTNWINKTGTLDTIDKKLLHWVVKVNNLKQTLNGVWIEDVLPKGLTPVDGSFYLRLPDNSRVAISEAAETTLGYYTLTTQSDGKILIRYDFDGEINDLYQLEFDTRITDLTIYDSNSAVSYTNTAYLGWIGNGAGTPSDTYTVSVLSGNGIISKTVSNNNQNFNFLTNNIQTWTVVINRNAITINNARFVDQLAKKYEYIPGSFRIITAGINGTFTYTSADVSDLTKSGTLEYVFSDPLSSSVTLSFQTKLVDVSQLYSNSTVGLSNTAQLFGDEIRNGTQTSTTTKNVYSQMIAKDIVVPYNYQTRRTTWRFIVNRNQLVQNNVVLTDVLPVGHRLIPESLTLSTNDPYEFTPTLQPADDLTNADSFTLAFTNQLSQQVVVTFESELREAVFLQSGDKTYTNRVTYTSDEIVTLTASVSQTIKNNVVTKSGAYLTGSDYIDWMVTINPNQVTLNDIELVDNLQAGLALDVSSVKLYIMDLNTDGTLTKQTQPVDTSAYQISYDPTTRVFKINIPGQINQAYRLEFTTDILVPTLNVNNTITLSGSGTTYNAGASQIAVVILDDDLNAGGGGVNASIRVQKLSSSDPTVKLSGAKFALYNSFNTKLAEATTDSDGIATFSGLGLKTYTIIEIEAPTGYHLDADPIRVRLTSTASAVQVDHYNDEITGSLTINKVLLDQNGQVLNTLRTFRVKVYGPSFPQGQEYDLNTLEPLIINNLLMGEYRVEELSAINYVVTISDPVVLSYTNYQQSITVTNREKARELPNTAAESQSLGYLIGVLLIAIGLLIKLIKSYQQRTTS